MKNMEDKEYTKCDICDSTQIGYPVKFSELNGKPRGIAQCKSCGLIHRNHEIDSSSNNSETAAISEDFIQKRRKIFEDYIQKMNSLRKLNRVLDIGHGPGFFLEECIKQGWNCYGIEVSKSLREQAEQRIEKFKKDSLQLELKLTETLEDFEDNSFDVVAFWNVLDYVRSPKKTMAEVYRVLRKGGETIARVPNSAFHLPIYRAIANLNKVYRIERNPATINNYSFNKANLERLYHDSGFQEVAIENAQLGWTTTEDKSNGIAKNLACKLTEAVTEAVSTITNKRILISPSLIVTARK